MGRPPIEIGFSEREIRRVIAEHLPKTRYLRLQLRGARQAIYDVIDPIGLRCAEDESFFAHFAGQVMEAARYDADVLGGLRRYDLAFDCDGRGASYTFTIGRGICIENDENKEDTVKEISVDVGRQEASDLAEARALAERLGALTKRVLDGEAARVELREVLALHNAERRVDAVEARDELREDHAPAAVAAPVPDGNGTVGPSKGGGVEEIVDALRSVRPSARERASAVLTALEGGPRSTSAIAALTRRAPYAKQALDLKEADVKEIAAALLAEGQIERVRTSHGWEWSLPGQVKTVSKSPASMLAKEPARTSAKK